jgi:hypothetical protein
LQQSVDDGLCVNHAAERIEIVEKLGQIGGREMDSADAGLARVDVTLANCNIVRENVGVVPGGILEWPSGSV